MKVLPITTLGKWTVRLIILFFVFFGLMQLWFVLGQRGGDTFLDNPLLSFTGLLMALFGVSAFVTGLISLIKFKERALLIFLITILGFLITIFIVGEFFFPH